MSMPLGIICRRDVSNMPCNLAMPPIGGVIPPYFFVKCNARDYQISRVVILSPDSDQIIKRECLANFRANTYEGITIH